MERYGIPIADSFAEAFSMRATRLVITAIDSEWAQIAGRQMSGFATSVIACGVEADIDAILPPEQTPDGRPGVSLLFFATSRKKLAQQIEARVGQCVLTCPSTSLFSGMEGGDPLPLGDRLRFFGDGYQISKQIEGRRYWRIPVMDGEFLCVAETGSQKAIGGGNFLILARSLEQALPVCRQAVQEMSAVPDIIMPFPGGIVRSGSKVGSKYPSLIASTNHRYCPLLRGLVDSALDRAVGTVLEIVINGLHQQAVREAMRVGVERVCKAGREAGILGIDAGHYGGRLGQFHFPLRELFTACD